LKILRAICRAPIVVSCYWEKKKSILESRLSHLPFIQNNETRVEREWKSRQNKTCVNLTIKIYSVYSPLGKNMLTGYYGQQGAFPKSCCRLCLPPSGSISETEILGESKMWSEKEIYFFSKYCYCFLQECFWFQSQIKAV